LPYAIEPLSADDENESDIKCNDEMQHGLLTEDQYVGASFSEPPSSLTGPHFISLADLSHLVGVPNLSKNQYELSASGLKVLHLLENGTKISLFRKRQNGMYCLFSQKSNFVYFNNVESLMTAIGQQHYPNN
jgi:hypothetical protein